jgi:hypothetical protein
MTAHLATARQGAVDASAHDDRAANANGTAQQPAWLAPDRRPFVAKTELSAWQQECLDQGRFAHQGSVNSEDKEQFHVKK